MVFVMWKNSVLWSSLFSVLLKDLLAAQNNQKKTSNHEVSLSYVQKLRYFHNYNHKSQTSSKCPENLSEAVCSFPFLLSDVSYIVICRMYIVKMIPEL